jgi:epoxyqueuosine reductase
LTRAAIPAKRALDATTASSPAFLDALGTMGDSIRSGTSYSMNKPYPDERRGDRMIREVPMGIAASGETPIQENIASFLQERGAGLFGFADLAPVPGAERYGLPRSISFGFPISKGILRQIASGPTLEYYKEYNRLNSLLINAANELERFISSLGYAALALEGEARRYDTRTLATILPHKTSASLAGLGWIGKCDLLVTEEFGSGLRLSTVLTDAPLTAGTPATESKCGGCKACVDNCPAKAVSGNEWRRGIPREKLYDAFACAAMTKKQADAIGADHRICGICISNCPWTLRYANG